MIENYRRLTGNQRWFPLFFIGLLLFLAACDSPQADSTAPATEAEQVATAVERVAAAEATWTPLPIVVNEEPEPTDPAPPTSTTVPTSTAAAATETPEPTDAPTETAEATATPEPTETAQPVATLPPAPTAAPTEPAAETSPTAPPPVDQPLAEEPSAAAEPVLGVNLLPNGSFEEGHYNQDGVPELQLPVKWRLEWSEAPTGLGTEAWDVFVRPEVRVLSTAFLPPEEHPLYIFNGQHTVKAFKGSGAIDFRLLTDVTLEPGTYVFEAKMFADIVDKWENRAKQWAQDPTAAEFRFLVGDGGTVWLPQNYGQVNVHNYTFTIDQTQTIPVGVNMKGKYAIANNGWFIDDLSIRRVE